MKKFLIILSLSLICIFLGCQYVIPNKIKTKVEPKLNAIPSTIIIDNTDTSYTQVSGNWTISTSPYEGGPYGINYLH